MGPDFGQIERIEFTSCRLLGSHNLNVHGPAGIISLGNRIEQISDGIVRIGSRELLGFFGLDEFDTLIRFVVEFAIVVLAFFVDQFERVGSVAVHVSIAVGNAWERKGHYWYKKRQVVMKASLSP